MITEKEVIEVENEVLREYEIFPRRIVEDANGEENISQSEQGRFLLELIQNADDAQIQEIDDIGSEKIGDAQLTFVLTEDSLYCANGGYPISKKGLKAICSAFLSPKRKNTPVIGFKGIGFKSILAITEEPKIYWKDHGIFFSRVKTIEILETRSSNILQENELREVAILRYPHLLDYNSEVNDDEILKELLSNHATVFKFPFKSDRSKVIALDKLEQIDSRMMLFLNSISKIVIKIPDVESKTIQIRKNDLREEDGDSQYKELSAEISEEKGRSDWALFSYICPLPARVKESLNKRWSDTDYISVSIAVSKSEEVFKPIDGESVLHVFFPTEQRVPFGFLMHGTFRTNLDRRLLVDDDVLNDFVFETAVNLIKDRVIPGISEKLAQPGAILDFFRPLEDTSTESTELKIWKKLTSVLRDLKFVPSWGGRLRLTPRDVLLSPLDKDVNQFKSLMPENIVPRLCDNSIDSDTKRRATIEAFGGTTYAFGNLPSLFEDNFCEDKKWIGEMYAVLDKVNTFLETNYTDGDADEFENECKEKKLIYTSQGKRVSIESEVERGYIFFPSIGEPPVPPKGINLSFLDRDVLDFYLNNVSKTIRETFLYKKLKVAEYNAANVIAETVIPRITEFWEKWPESKVFEPTEVLQFLEELFDISEVTLTQRMRNLRKMPIPIIENNGYAEASDVYASESWTDNDDLEIIYGKERPFLYPPDPNTEQDAVERRKNLLKTIGVSFLPKVFTYGLNKDRPYIYHNYWDSHSKEFLVNSNIKPANWSKYCLDVYNDNLTRGSQNPFSSYELYLETTHTLDGFELIIKDQKKSDRLLKVLAHNWSFYISKMNDTVQCREKSARNTYEKKIESYLSWRLRNAEWLPPENFKFWNFKSPKDIFFKNEGAYQKLGDLLPVIEPEDKQMDEFLGHIGVRRGINSLEPRDWWRIATDLPNRMDPIEKDVNPIYREMLNAKGLEEDCEEKNTFLRTGKVLARVNGKFEFVDRGLAWYIEGEEVRKLFEDSVPVFSIKHEENRGASIKKLFGVSSLEQFVESQVKAGQKDSELTERYNQFLDKLKPFLLARINKQRPSRQENDVSLMRRLRIEGKKGLSVTFNLKVGENTITRNSDRGMYIDKTEQSIYIDTTKFSLRNEERWRNDVAFCRQLGIQISQFMNSDSADILTILIGQTQENRFYLLETADISREDVSRFSELLGEYPEGGPLKVLHSNTIHEPNAEEVNDEPEDNDESSNDDQEIETSGGTETTRPPMELWNTSDLTFDGISVLNPVSKEQPNANNGPGGSGGGGIGRPRDHDTTTSIEKAGVAIAVAFEEARHKKEHQCNLKIKSVEKEKVGYDLESECQYENRYIEVKATSGNMDVIDLTAQEWEVARENGETAYLYRVENLDKSRGVIPDIIIVKNPYIKFEGEPLSFKLKLSKITGKYERASHIKKADVTEPEIP